MNNLSEKISDSELEVMRVLWAAGCPLPITEIRQALQQKMGWEATTVKTLVGRLLAKGVLAQQKLKVFYYSALVSEQEYNDWATGNLIKKLYKGSAKALVAALVQSDGLSKDDLDELRSFFKMEE